MTPQKARQDFRLVLATAVVTIFCANAARAIEPAEEAKIVSQWQAKRLQNLTSPTGWLTLVGLYWLHEGDNSFGRDAGNKLVLNHPALPPTLGKFTLQAGKVKFVARNSKTVVHAGRAVDAIEMVPDSKEEPTTLAAGSVQFYVIDRAGKLGVRVRDTQHPQRTHFKGLEYFPTSVAWAIDAKFERYEPVKHIDIVNILGMTEAMVSPGALVFTKDGKEWRLDTLLEEPDATELFIMFADATSGRETYGAGRFIYIPLPQNGHAMIDFNRSYNPPCAFNDFATCPLPPRQNRLSLRIDAGEKKYSAD